ncbi:LacI family DNA-binding transcriptional regulator [Cellulomonas hominis]|uniref:LacI family DNA-binding transcriptional regulator n=1 Tax=Cellulomonas hominis TaxID=156981 RepID=UPI001B9E8709|nr:LacI family DNA-binding transcriptional regulator [Cellulomonas hominis]VTR77598.1 Catabolite control protein A [Cellulomonas hominis]
MVTMQDVARRAGVALSTVSASLTGARPVSVATRARVTAAMDELGYRPNALARGLASRRSRVLALTYPVGDAGLSRTSAEFVLGAAEVAQQRGYQLVLWPFAVDDAEGIVEVARQGLADGVLLMEVHLDDVRVRALRAAGVPVALIGRTAGDADLPSVDVDFAATLSEAVAHLADLGHRRIAFVNHAAHRVAEGHGPTVRASAAYEQAMTDRGLTPVQVHAEESVPGGRAALAGLLGSGDRPTAVITMNEDATFGVVAELAARGVTVPDGLSVLAVVSSPAVAGQTVPPLTTMHAPGARLGAAGVDALLALLDDGSTPPPALVPCRLVDCGSTGPAPVRAGAAT